MPNVWIIIISLLILLVGCPLLGRLLYKMENKQAFILYGTISFAITVLLFFFTDHVPLETVIEGLGDYFSHFFQPAWIIFLTFFTYITSGFGLIGGVLEYVSEEVETAESYKTYKRIARIKLILYFFIYGYIFIFAVFAFSQFLIIFFQWEYKVSLSFFDEILRFMQFYSIILSIFGSILFAIKVFNVGFFSLEFYKSEFDPSITKIGPKMMALRHVIGCFIGTLGVFTCILIYFLETFENSIGLNLYLGKAFYFLAATIQAILFYSFRNKFVDQLKPMKEQYELKPTKSGTAFLDEEDKSLESYDSELKFDD